MFNCNQTLDENKALSPLTLYQPFQSTFDPDFTSQTPKTTPEEPTDSHMKRWRQESESQLSNLNIHGRTLSPWDEAYSGGFHPDIHGESSGFLRNPHPITGGTTSGWPGEMERRNVPLTSSLPNLLSVSPDRPRQPHSGNGDGTTGGAASPLAGRNFGSEASFSLVANNRPGFGSFDGANFRLGTSLGQPSQVSPISTLYYPLMVSPLDRNLSQNLYNRSGHSRPMICNFCKNNKEVPDIYMNHYLYDPETKVLTCPVLRKHKCEICGCTGDRAHTLQYCPVNRERGLQAKVPVLLKTRTITNSTGKIRRN